MPRPLRIEYEGAIYNVLNRGNRREPIFMDDADRQRFVETLGEACAKADWQVHALPTIGWIRPSRIEDQTSAAGAGGGRVHDGSGTPRLIPCARQ
jgi:hypothetical protein